jgi:hypothetical protein
MLSENFEFKAKPIEQTVKEDLIQMGELLVKNDDIEGGRKYFEKAGLSKKEIEKEIKEIREIAN